MNKPLWVKLFKLVYGAYPICGGGGSSPTVQQQPTAPAPSASESAGDIYKARLQYDPLIAQQEMDLQKKMLPQQSALYQSLYNQYYPEMARQQQTLQRELYPQQSQLLEAGAGQALQRMQSPDYMTSEEQKALEYGRGQQINELQKAMRERANLGGGLYGGRAAGAEAKSVTDLLQQFELQDYQRRMGAGQAAQQALIPYMQILYPQIGTTQPQYSPYQYQSAVPSPDNLYNAMFQASQPDTIVNPGKASQSGAIAGGVGSAIGGIALMI